MKLHRVMTKPSQVNYSLVVEHQKAVGSTHTKEHSDYFGVSLSLIEKIHISSYNILFSL